MNSVNAMLDVYRNYTEWYNKIVAHYDPMLRDELKRTVEALAELEELADTLGYTFECDVKNKLVTGVRLVRC